MHYKQWAVANPAPTTSRMVNYVEELASDLGHSAHLPALPAEVLLDNNVPLGPRGINASFIKWVKAQESREAPSPLSAAEHGKLALYGSDYAAVYDTARNDLERAIQRVRDMQEELMSRAATLREARLRSKAQRDGFDIVKACEAIMVATGWTLGTDLGSAHIEFFTKPIEVRHPSLGWTAKLGSYRVQVTFRPGSLPKIMPRKKNLTLNGCTHMFTGVNGDLCLGESAYLMSEYISSGDWAGYGRVIQQLLASHTDDEDITPYVSLEELVLKGAPQAHPYRGNRHYAYQWQVDIAGGLDELREAREDEEPKLERDIQVVDSFDRLLLAPDPEPMSGTITVSNSNELNF